MRILLIFAAIAFGLNSCGSADEFVVELECIVFDRDLIDAENAAIQEQMKEIPRKSQGAVYSSLRLQSLRQHARQHINSKATLIVGLSESSSHTFSTEDFKTEAHINVFGVNDSECEIDVQWGMAYRPDARSVTTPRITGKFKVPLNVERTLGGGGTNSHNAVFVLTVRKAQLDDLQPKRLSVHFGLDLPNPVPR
jgi:hypothetical protein